MKNRQKYAGSSKPQGAENYAPQALVADVFQLADALGLASFTVVGHDWGGAIAWAVALWGQPGAPAAGRVSRLVIANAPHPALFQHLLFTHEGQRLASQRTPLGQAPREVVPFIPSAPLRSLRLSLARPCALHASLSRSDWLSLTDGEGLVQDRVITAWMQYLERKHPGRFSWITRLESDEEHTNIDPFGNARASFVLWATGASREMLLAPCNTNNNSHWILMAFTKSADGSVQMFCADPRGIAEEDAAKYYAIFHLAAPHIPMRLYLFKCGHFQQDSVSCGLYLMHFVRESAELGTLEVRDPFAHNLPQWRRIFTQRLLRADDPFVPAPQPR